MQLKTNYCQGCKDCQDEVERLRKALIKVCDRAHKVQVGCPSESFDIAIKEAKLMLNDTMPLAPFPNESPFPSTEIKRLRTALGDLIGLAEAAMRDANRDGAEYDINAELTDAREALADD